MGFSLGSCNHDHNNTVFKKTEPPSLTLGGEAWAELFIGRPCRSGSRALHPLNPSNMTSINLKHQLNTFDRGDVMNDQRKTDRHTEPQQTTPKERMSQPSQQPLPPKKTAGTRSRTGCWTCRARRKKCDEKRPGCTPCATKGVPCGGYGARLKWGNGVASRGYLTGASIPVPRAEGNNTARKGAAAGVKGTAKKDANGKEGRGVPDGKGKGVGGPGPVGGAVMVMDMGMGMDMGTSKTTEPVEEGYKSGELVLDFGQGPARNEASRVSPSPAAGSSSIGSSVATPDMLFSDAMVPDGVRLSPFDAMLFQECKLRVSFSVVLFEGRMLMRVLYATVKEWGSFYLWVSADTSKPPFHDVLSLCAHSKSLLANCLTFQLSLHPEYEGKFDEYYAESLRLFRQDVVEPSYMMKDATLVSGILLCSIGVRTSIDLAGKMC